MDEEVQACAGGVEAAARTGDPVGDREHRDEEGILEVEAREVVEDAPAAEVDEDLP